jgi:DNA-binding CsgD family transcriptional regulator
MDEVTDESERGLRILLVCVLLATIVGGAIDLYLDAPETWLSWHVAFELFLVALALATTVVLWRAWGRAHHSLGDVRRALEAQRAERDAWRASAQRALDGLADAIDEQFRAWGLTPTEREVALLLLKGQSHKQIAYDTDRSERTVRQHAAAVYQKSGLGGRAELAAFFLEDLMLPEPAREGAARTGPPRS